MTKTSKPWITQERPIVLWAIFAICVCVELVLSGVDFGLWESPRLRLTAYQYGGFWVGLLYNWIPNYPAQPYLMFATYAFLHGGLIHLSVNMITLFSLSPLILTRIGPAYFALLYALSAVGGGAGFALLSDSPQPMVGASGALFGLTGAILAWEYFDRQVDGIELWPVVRIVVALAAFNLVLWWAMDGQLAWETHLGGFVFGWIFAVFVGRRAETT